MRPTRHLEILTGLVLLGTAALCSTAALATVSAETPSLPVKYAQSDLQDAASAQALYHRIQRAARIVCQQPNARESVQYHLYEVCYRRAVDTAVANVGATTLTAVHRNHNGHTQAAG